MKRTRFIWAFALLTLVGATTLAEAARLPQGSYRRTCNKSYINKEGALVSHCKRKDGSWIWSFLPRPWKCNEVWNNDGFLSCG